MIDDQRMAHLERVYPVGGSDLYTDVRDLLAEVKALRGALGVVASMDMFIGPHSEIQDVYKRLMDSVAVAHAALGTQMRGPGVLKQTSGPAANNEAQRPPDRTQKPGPGVSGVKTQVPARDTVEPVNPPKIET